MNSTKATPSGPYTTHDLTLVFVLSLAIALLMAVASAAGLIFADVIYPTDELAQTFVANDVVNLVIGLPILLGSIWLARRGKLVGLLCWPGTLLYVLYNYLIYLFGAPLNWVFLLFVSRLSLCCCNHGSPVQPSH